MRLRLRLMGQVRLSDEDGRDLTPRGRKARGLLVLLAMAPDLRLGRAQLQDKLWSESPPAQGSASLRQALHECRQALGPALIGGDGWAGLDPARVTIDLAPVTGPTGQPSEFAEGLDIDDPEFEDWLRDTRLALEDRPAPDERLQLVLSDAQGDGPQARMLADCALSEAAARAAALIPAQVMRQSLTRPSGPGLLIEALCMAQPRGGVVVMMVLRDLQSGAQLWAQHYPLAPGLPDLRRASAAMALTMIQTAGQITRRTGGLYPLGDLFSFSRARLLAADQRLAASPGPVPQALRAFLRYTLIIERQGGDPRILLDEADALARQAREAAPCDPVVLSVAALMASWRGQVSGALDLARLACRMAPGHDLAQLALSQALNDAGRDSEALVAALRAGTGPLAVLGPASWRLRLAVAQIRTGRLAEAEDSASAALAHAPDCRPALRMLAALRHHRGDEAGAVSALEALRRAEPDFSLPLMASPDYPVTTLRRAGLLGVTRSGL
ncbi:SARP family transcriptional regulator [Paracoccus sp. (in: a-proteobacteria)]|uniref:SARP family transcriptional regulator n=1 Tax=Paracoccus sp. TaxID=267 RepID=UPI002729BBC2|nr:SARP family transcriptional regulator [Paracoccus sp. (in: a-proteobacteria)]